MFRRATTAVRGIPVTATTLPTSCTTSAFTIENMQRVLAEDLEPELTYEP